MNNKEKNLSYWIAVHRYLQKEWKKMVTSLDIENWFSYHAPQGTQQDRYIAIRDKAKELAHLIIETTPPSADQTVAIRKLRECVMTANAAIACGE